MTGFRNSHGDSAFRWGVSDGGEEEEVEMDEEEEEADDDWAQADIIIAKPKITLLGDSTVGKSTLLRPWLIDPVEQEALKTFGFKVAKRVEKGIELNDERTMDSYLMLFEVDGDRLADLGEERLQVAMGGSAGVMVMADCLRVDTLEAILFQLDKYFETVKKDRPILITANKLDVLDIVRARIMGRSVTDQIREELRTATNPNIQTKKAVYLYLDELNSTLNTVDPEDLLFHRSMEYLAEQISHRFGEATHLFLSAATGRNVDVVFRQMAKLTIPKSLM